VTGKRKEFSAPELREFNEQAVDYSLDARGFVTLSTGSGDAVRVQVKAYLGKGIDDWVWTTLRCVARFLASNEVRTSTAMHYWRSGLSKLFEFVIERCPDLMLRDFGPGDVRQFISWLKNYSTFDKDSSTAKSVYTNVKPVLSVLQHERSIEHRGDLFPRNPFPGSNACSRKQQPLSEAEQARLQRALKADLVQIHRGTDALTPLERLVVHVTALATRIGPNTAPLLNHDRIPLASHPTEPKNRVMTLNKHRGNATVIRNLRKQTVEEQPVVVPGKAIAIYEHLMAQSAALAPEAPKRIRNRLLLYRRMKSGSAPAAVTVLTPRTLYTGMEKLVHRHGLRSDDGSPLKLNFSRFRLSRVAAMEDRGITVTRSARANDHSVPVHESHYHVVTERMLSNAAHAVENLKGSILQASTETERTPVSGCKDTLYGEFAPKEGKSRCVDFLSCIGCRSLALIQSDKDLHRFFSFYWFCVHESKGHPGPSWRELFSATVDAIDRFVQAHLKTALVRTARERARVSPVTFWRTDVCRS
jgi:hypothetical protein